MSPIVLLSGDLSVSASLININNISLVRGPSFIPSSSSSSSSYKVDFAAFSNGASIISEPTSKWRGRKIHKHCTRVQSERLSGISADFLSTNSVSHELESFLLSTLNMNFFERLNLAWKIVFPSATTRQTSNASIAKHRLKMILFSDRCAVSDEAKRKIVDNIVRSLSDFVEIESQDKVQLSVSDDTDIGTVYSITVPVRRVKPEHQDTEELGSITNMEYLDKGEKSGSVDVKFDFYIPDK
ncbi:hypothetical protein ACFE04_025247 [Oxalis oulophora]